MSEHAAPDVLVSGHAPETILAPRSLDELRAAVLRDDGLTLVPAGGRTALDLGDAPARPFALLDLRQALRGELEHQADDLTLVAPAGMTLGEIDALLRPSGQFLPLDPPLAPSATIGGVLSAGAAGPLRPKYGLPRDAVIGMTVLRADRELVRAGGPVALRVLPRPDTVDLAAEVAPGRAADLAARLAAADIRPDILDLIEQDGVCTALLRSPVLAADAAVRATPELRWKPAPAGLYEAVRDLGAGSSSALTLRLAALPSHI
ncbi:MAG TPA: FAD-binding oxidoreductase, partial [Tepidiformaceae bacterium]|nr:FAD-binding oxidoreductase [Tepidiformaceae bacterium]